MRRHFAASWLSCSGSELLLSGRILLRTVNSRADFYGISSAE